MATPTNSILYYLQCVGRVVRTPENDKSAKAYVIEIVDKLPNISYRIDNRWLFSEISDYLEPRIEDVKSCWPFRVFHIFAKLFRLRAKISDLSRDEVFSLLKGKKINMLLFNDVPHEAKYSNWRILSLSPNQHERIMFFNELSENIEDLYSRNHEYLFQQRYSEISNQNPINSRVYRSSIMKALHRAFQNKSERRKVDSLIYLSVK